MLAKGNISGLLRCKFSINFELMTIAQKKKLKLVLSRFFLFHTIRSFPYLICVFTARCN